jgi:hypothetical protein
MPPLDILGMIHPTPHTFYLCLARKSILRGALTNRHEWIFLILYLNKDGEGGTYTESPTVKIQVSESYPYHVLPPGPDIVAGILAYWVSYTLISSASSHEQMLDGAEFR